MLLFQCYKEQSRAVLICLKCICLLVFRSTKDAGSFNLKIPRGILIPQMFFLISKFSYLLLKGWFTSSRKKKKKKTFVKVIQLFLMKFLVYLTIFSFLFFFRLYIVNVDAIVQISVAMAQEYSKYCTILPMTYMLYKVLTFCLLSFSMEQWEYWKMFLKTLPFHLVIWFLCL